MGSSPEVLRIPSVLAMTAAVAIVALLTRRLTGSGWAGLFAGLVMALTPIISFYAQTARSYAMVLACVRRPPPWSWSRALDAEAAGAARQRTLPWWLGYGALVVVGGYLNEMSLLMLAAHAVTVVVARYRRQVVWRWAVHGRRERRARRAAHPDQRPGGRRGHLDPPARPDRPAGPVP